MRYSLLVLHKYIGLVLGGLISIIGLTGSIVVFDHAIDERLAPETLDRRYAEGHAPLSEVLAAAKVAVGAGASPTRITLAREKGSAHVVRFPAPPGAPGPLEVSVAPSTAEVLGVRIWGDYAVSWVYRLHYTLLSGTTGKYVVGVLGLCLLFFCVSGIVIWWPRHGRWYRALTIKRGAGTFRLNYDLHKTAGVYLLPVLFVVSLSGVSIVFPGQFDAVVARVLPVDAEPAPRSAPSSAEPINIDHAVIAASAVFPGADLKRVHLPAGPDGTFALHFRQRGEPWSHYAATAVWVDRYRGEVLAVRDAMSVSAGTKFLDWQFPLHNGDALGLAGRWLVFVCGWLPALLFGTGVYMWWAKRLALRRPPASSHVARAD